MKKITKLMCLIVMMCTFSMGFAQDITLLTEGFESGIPTTWTTIDSDNDGFNWTIISGLEGHSGSTATASSNSYDNASGALTPDNWLITPQIALTGAPTTLKFYVCAQDASYAAEHYAVYLSTTGTAVANFTTTLLEETITAKNAPATKAVRGTTVQGAWYEKTIDLTSYTGNVYVAIRHYNCTDQYIFNLDDVTVTAVNSNVPAAPTAFTVTPGANNALTAALAWTNPSTTVSGTALTALTSVVITRNGNVIETINNPTVGAAATYSDAVPANGVYNYTVYAVSADGNGAAASAQAIIGDVQDDPITNLTATFDNEATVNLSWTAPAGVGSWITWSTLVAGSGIGYGATVASDFYVAQRWTAAELTAYAGQQLQQVSFVPGVANTACAYTITVWQGNTTIGTDEDGITTYTPGNVVVSQDVTETFAGGTDWVTVTLTTPLTIDATQDMWIGYRANGTGYTAGADGGPAVIGKGGLILDGGVYYDLADMGLNYNWCIKGYVEAAASKSMTEIKAIETVMPAANEGTLSAQRLTNFNDSRANEIAASYDVFADGEFVANTSTTNYSLSVLTTGEHNYCVEVNYGDYNSVAVCESVNVTALACAAPTNVSVSDYSDTYGEGVIGIFASDVAGAVIMKAFAVDQTTGAEMLAGTWNPAQYSGVLTLINVGETYYLGVKAGCLFNGSTTDTVWSALSDTVGFVFPLVCLPAESLNGQAANGNVNLMWSPSANGIAYNIYRNGEAIATGIEDNYYTDANVPDGTHDYAVAAVCIDGSEAEAVTFTITVGINENAAMNAVLFPNPANESINIQAMGMQHVSIATILGQVVYEAEVNSDNVVVNTTNLQSGAYMVTITTETGSASKRITVIR